MMTHSIKKCLALILLSMASTALTSCGNKSGSQVVFVTGSPFSDLGAVSHIDADLHCQTAADATVFSNRTFKAIYCSATSNAKDRLAVNGGKVYLSTSSSASVEIAITADKLWDPTYTLINPINTTETFTNYVLPVRTGCDTSGVFDDKFNLGEAGAVDATRLNNTNDPATTYPIYCLSGQ